MCEVLRGSNPEPQTNSASAFGILVVFAFAARGSSLAGPHDLDAFARIVHVNTVSANAAHRNHMGSCNLSSHLSLSLVLVQVGSFNVIRLAGNKLPSPFLLLCFSPFAQLTA